MSTVIECFESTNNFLICLTICPFLLSRGGRRSEFRLTPIAFHLTFLSLYVIVLLISAYYTFMYANFVFTKLSECSIVITYIMLAQSFPIGVIISLINRKNQIKLFYKIDRFDMSIQATLCRSLKNNAHFRRMVCLSGSSIIYSYLMYIISAIYFEDNFPTIIFYACCTHSEIFFSVYLLYISLWGHLYVHRITIVNDNLQRLLQQPIVLHTALESLLGIYQHLFEIRALIERTFGSILFYTIFYHSLTIAVAIYTLVYGCLMHGENFYENLITGMAWMMPLCWRGWYLVHVFQPIGDEVWHCMISIASNAMFFLCTICRSVAFSESSRGCRFQMTVNSPQR